MIKFEYKDICYITSDFSEYSVMALMKRLGVFTIDVFVSPKSIGWVRKTPMKLRDGIFTRTVRVWPDATLELDEWVARTKYFEVHCEGA